jgi:hypothetical protein
MPLRAYRAGIGDGKTKIPGSIGNHAGKAE